MLVLLWSAPASAEDASYGRTAAENVTLTGIVLSDDVDVVADDDGEFGLARTGQDNVTPLVQLSIVLMGVGAMLVFVARRRRLGGIAA